MFYPVNFINLIFSYGPIGIKFCREMQWLLYFAGFTKRRQIQLSFLSSYTYMTSMYVNKFRTLRNWNPTQFLIFRPIWQSQFLVNWFLVKKTLKRYDCVTDIITSANKIPWFGYSKLSLILKESSDGFRQNVEPPLWSPLVDPIVDPFVEPQFFSNWFIPS